MSRIGIKPISVPAGVEVTVADGNVVTVKGPKGSLTKEFHKDMIIKCADGVIKVPARPDPYPDPQHGRGCYRGFRKEA